MPEVLLSAVRINVISMNGSLLYSPDILATITHNIMHPKGTSHISHCIMIVVQKNNFMSKDSTVGLFLSSL